MSDADPRKSPEAQARFEALQQKLIPLWHSIRALGEDPQTIVVIPSMDVDMPLIASEMQAYEERYLFLLLLLRQPRARLIYATGQAIHPSVLDYYFDLMPGVISSNARKRLFLVSPLDASPRPLTRKLLDRPRMIERIRSLIPDMDRAHLVPFATTWDDRELAMRIGIPMYGNDPRLLDLGSKSSGRRLFREEGVPLPAGREDLHSEDDLVDAILSMRKDDADLARVVIKLNQGVSGTGNANLDLRDLPDAGTPGEAEAVRKALPGMRFELEGLAHAHFLEKLAEQGGIVEERIVAEEILSPSVQLRVTPLRDVELLSTHDQVLGGADGQRFMGCRFPANASYAAMISREAEKIGRRLAELGALGRFALDFVVARTAGGSWKPYAIEINLRKGGTTHPFLTLQFLTDGTYDAEAATFHAPDGKQKYFVASDHVESPAYRTLVPEDLFEMALLHGLHFDQTRLKGIVFHMMSALPESGRVGLTAVGDSHEEANQIYQRCVALLEAETRDG